MAKNANSIIGSGLQLAQTDGLGLLSSRKLAAAAGVSLSSVQNAGTMEDLRTKIAELAQSQADLWQAKYCSNLDTGLAKVTVEGFITSAVLGLAISYRSRYLLMAELLFGNNYPEIKAKEQKNSRRWVNALLTLGCSENTATTWVDFFYGLVSLAALDQLPASLHSWVPLLVARLSDRINRRPTFHETDFPFVSAEMPVDAQVSKTAQGILEATIELIAEKGVEHLSHRIIARRAGVSLATPTYFFSTKSDLIIAAIHELLRRTHVRLREHITDHPIARSILTPDGKLNQDMRAIMALYVPVARDPHLRAAASALRDLRGPVALETLQIRHRQTDRVDALLWSTIMHGVMHPCRIPLNNIETELERRAELHEAQLFYCSSISAISAKCSIISR